MDLSFHQNKPEIDTGRRKKQVTEYITQPNQKYKYKKDYHDYKQVFRTVLMAIYKTLRIITTKYPNEPAYIFTDCLNCIYVINTQIKHPTQQNNHADKTILKDIAKMLENRTQFTTIYKVKAHINIEGNEKADTLAKDGLKK